MDLPDCATIAWRGWVLSFALCGCSVAVDPGSGGQVLEPMPPTAVPVEPLAPATSPAPGAEGDLGGAGAPSSDQAPPIATGAPDARAPDETRAPGDQVVAAPGSTLCSLRLPWDRGSWIYDPGGASANLPSDSKGNVYFVGTFAGTVDLGQGPLTTHGTNDGFVIKLDAQCRPIWIKQLGGTAGTLVGAAVVTVGPADDLFVGGTLNGSADFGAGELHTRGSDNASNDAALVLRLDADGEVLWSKTFQSTWTGNRIHDIGVSAAGDVVFSGLGGTQTSFDGNPPAAESDRTALFVASLDALGNYRFSHLLYGSDAFGSIAVHASGRVAISGWAFDVTSGTTVPGLSWSVGTWDHYVLALDASGAFEWGRQLESVGDGEWSGLLGNALAFDAAGNLVIDHGRSTYLDGQDAFAHDPGIVRKLDAAGDDVWVTESVYAGPDDVEWLGELAVDAQGNIVHTDEIQLGNSLDGEVFAVQGPTDILVRKRAPNGDLLWTRQLGGDLFEELPWSIATDPSDAVWVGYTAADIDAGTGEVVITRLAP